MFIGNRGNEIYNGIHLMIDSNVYNPEHGMLPKLKYDVEVLEKRIETGMFDSNYLLDCKELVRCKYEIAASTEKKETKEIKQKIETELNSYMSDIKNIINGIAHDGGDFNTSRIIYNLYLIGIQDFWVYILYECAKGTKGWIDLVNDSYNSNLLRKSPCLINIGLTDYEDNSSREGLDANLIEFAKKEICLPEVILQDCTFDDIIKKYNLVLKHILADDEKIVSSKPNRKCYTRSMFSVIKDIRTNLEGDIVLNDKVEEIRNIFYALEDEVNVDTNEEWINKFERFIKTAKYNKDVYEEIRSKFGDEYEFPFVDKKVMELLTQCHYSFEDVMIDYFDGIDRISSRKIKEFRTVFLETLAIYLVNKQSNVSGVRASKDKKNKSYDKLLQEISVFKFLFEFIKWCDSNVASENVIKEFHSRAVESFENDCSNRKEILDEIKRRIEKQYFVSTLGIFGFTKRRCSDFWTPYEIPVRKGDKDEITGKYAFLIDKTINKRKDNSNEFRKIYDSLIDKKKNKIKGDSDEITDKCASLIDETENKINVDNDNPRKRGSYDKSSHLCMQMANNREVFSKLYYYGNTHGSLNNFMTVNELEVLDYASDNYLKSLYGLGNDNLLISNLLESSDGISSITMKRRAIYASMIHDYVQMMVRVTGQKNFVNGFVSEDADAVHFSSFYDDKGITYLNHKEYMDEAKRNDFSVVEQYEESDRVLAESFFYLDWNIQKVLEILLGIVLEANSEIVDREYTDK